MLNIGYKTNEKGWKYVDSFDKISNNAISIDCINNELTTLPEFEKFTNLEKIYCTDNELVSIPNWYQLINLKEIHCDYNKLTILPEWNHLIKLEIINCNHNQLTNLHEWEQLTNLNTIECDSNRLVTLPKWTHLINLKEISCLNNKIKSLPIEWTRLPNLQNICYYHNPIEYFPPSIARILNRQSIGQNIYQDNQSVHNHQIQISLRNSIEYLIKDKPSISLDQMKQEIEKQCLSYELLTNYCKDQSVHSVLNVTFEEVLLSVWSKIRNHNDRQEIIKVLNIEMLDSECKCFTGRLTRLVNCLNGFDDNIKLEISDNEQMSNISKLLYQRYDNIEDYQRELRKEFEERGYSEEDIQKWILIE
jgi:hypothetical protein